MSFLWPDLLWLLWFIPILILAYVLFQRRRKKYTLRYATLSLVKEAAEPRLGFRRHIPPILFLIGLIAMTIALARPVADVTVPARRGTVILAIDISSSMREDDIKPNRLEAAKSAARTFVRNQPDNINLGIVSFSATASIVQAPTRDHEAVTDAINRLKVEDSTAIGSAILVSLEAIFASRLATPEPVSSLTPTPQGTHAPAAIVLLTDGVSNTGPLPLDAAREAIDRGVRIYTIGMGTEETTNMSYYGIGSRVQLDEYTLKQVAEKTDGLYFNAITESDLGKIYQNLSTQLVFDTEQTELTVVLTGLAVVLVIIAGIISLLWFNRLP